MKHLEQPGPGESLPGFGDLHLDLLASQCERDKNDAAVVASDSIAAEGNVVDGEGKSGSNGRSGWFGLLEFNHGDPFMPEAPD